MKIQTDSQAVERVRAVVSRSKLDRVSCDLLWNATTAADMRAIIRARLPACPLCVALLAACGPEADVRGKAAALLSKAKAA